MTRANALASKAQYQEAIKCYDKILAKTPGNLDALNNRGNCLSPVGRHEQAIKNYNVILAARPNDMRARKNRAIALKQVGRCTEALAEFGRLIEADPRDADLLYHRGTTFSDLVRPEEAIRDLRRGDAQSQRLTAAGLEDYIAQDLRAYVELAVAKARDLAALAQLRTVLRRRIVSSEFGDPSRYARAVEALYRTIWRDWCEKHGRKPN